MATTEEKEMVSIEKKKIDKLVRNFHTLCGFCIELDIYEWEDCDKDMKEMQEWVSENFPKKKKKKTKK